MYRQRFVGEIPKEYSKLGQLRCSPSENDFEIQELLLNKLLAHAVKNVPFYRSCVEERGLSLGDVNSKNYEQIFPVLSKQDIVSDPQSFFAIDKGSKKDSFILSTSGSSGTPLRILTNKQARRINYRYYEFLLKEFGASYRERSTTFAGRVLYKNLTNGVSRYDYYNSTQYLSSYFLSETSVNSYFDAICSWKPKFIDAYPSIIGQFVDLCLQKNLKLNFSPKFVLTSSETLTKAVRNKIENFFGCPVVDHYGCTEMAISAFSDGGDYYLDPKYAKVELVSVGENIYKVIATGLFNYAMPLIRYDIGDTVSLSEPGNPYKFNAVEGRLDDLVVTPEGRKIGRLDPCFKGIQGVRYSQVIQKSLTEIEIKVVLDDEHADLFIIDDLLKNFAQRTSDKINFTVTLVNDIERSANGKFKSVVSLM